MARKKKETQISENNNNTTVVKEKKPKAISPFDIIGYMFQRNNKFDELSNLMMERNFFMINRTCAIMYPLHAQFFNKLGINESHVIKSWRMFLLKQHGYGRTPAFVYTKGSKLTTSKTLKESPLKDFSKELQNQFCMHYHYSLKDFQDMLQFYPDYLIEKLKQYKSIIHSDNVIEKTKQK